jgi:transcriptional regulator GlxA family with amidase domain
MIVDLLPVSRVLLLAFDGAQGLDLVGPADVFAAAGHEVVVASAGGGRIRLTSAIAVETVALARLRPVASDTVLVVGGNETAIRAAVSSPVLIDWLLRASRVARRLGSVCSGAFILAHAGLLDGRRVATHWSACARLAAFRPQLTVDAQSIFVHQGRVWTSAGVTAGLDMALAMIEEDHGRPLADTIARTLVLYARRPGFQAQFSEALLAQSEALGTSAPVADVLAWARANLKVAGNATVLARRAGMSLRTFHRRCVDELGTTPAKLIEGLRLEAARQLLSTRRLGTKTVALRCGFGTAARMARVFRRTLGMTPSDYALLHGRRERLT